MFTHKQHWTYFLPDFRATLGLSQSLGRIGECSNDIDHANRTINEIESSVEKRVLKEYSVEEVAQAKALASNQPNIDEMPQLRRGE